MRCTHTTQGKIIIRDRDEHHQRAFTRTNETAHHDDDPYFAWIWVNGDNFLWLSVLRGSLIIFTIYLFIYFILFFSPPPPQMALDTLCVYICKIFFYILTQRERWKRCFCFLFFFGNKSDSRREIGSLFGSTPSICIIYGLYTHTHTHTHSSATNDSKLKEKLIYYICNLKTFCLF